MASLIDFKSKNMYVQNKLKIICIKNKPNARYFVPLVGLNKIIKNEIAIRIYKIVHATGKYVGGGVKGGFINFLYHKFIIKV